MQLKLLSRIKAYRPGPLATGIAALALLCAFCAYAFLCDPGEGAVPARSVTQVRIMSGEDDVRDPLEYAELLPGIKININTAQKHALALLPGIGEKRAEAIIAYREENGGFSSKEEIMNINGIGEGIFGLIKELITLGDS